MSEDYLGGCILGGPFGDERTYAPALWKEMIHRFAPRSLLDIGCGGGYSLKWFLDHMDVVNGLEAYPPALKVLEQRGLGSHVIPFDFTKDDASRLCGPHDGKWDLGWCCEVVEHVDEAHLKTLLDVFSKCRVVAMTHAVPGQAGHHHVNCQKADYWIAALRAAGFNYWPGLSSRFRSIPEASSAMGEYPRATLLVFHDGSDHASM